MILKKKKNRGKTQWDKIFTYRPSIFDWFFFVGKTNDSMIQISSSSSWSSSSSLSIDSVVDWFDLVFFWKKNMRLCYYLKEMRWNSQITNQWQRLKWSLIFDDHYQSNMISEKVWISTMLMMINQRKNMPNDLTTINRLTIQIWFYNVVLVRFFIHITTITTTITCMEHNRKTPEKKIQK